VNRGRCIVTDGKRSRAGKGSVALLEQRLFASVKKSEMLRAGDRVGVAVSGGADSVALLLLLLELCDKLGVVLGVVHFNHKLRGKASEADEEFVAKLAVKHGLEFHVGSTRVAKKAKQERANLEDAARRARYDYFRALVESGKLARIAVAHTADDQAETVLAHLMRGTGLAGLGGIHPVVGGIIRPLLGVRRQELRTFLRTKKQHWREDLTNRDTKRMRARIRMKLLPLLEKQFQPAIVEHLCTLANLAREDEAFFETALQEWATEAVKRNVGEARISVPELLRLPHRKKPNAETTEGAEDKEEKEAASALSKRLVRRIVEEVKRRPGQLGASHVNAVLELAGAGRTGSSLSLPGGVEVRKERDALVFRTKEGEASGNARGAARTYEYRIDMVNGEKEIAVAELGCVFRLRVIDWPAQRGETSKDVAVLDRDRVRFPLVLRNWRPGDRLRPLGHRSAHKLKSLLNKKHISRWERDGWPVLTSGETLLWARGFPLASEFAADERTREGIIIAEEQL
jgi:tRNA(Ile)-lysidine synthase